MKKSENTRQSLELSHILKQHGDQYCDQYNPCTQQKKALRAITSCRNKHCPKCQFIKQEKWVDKLKEKLLPVKHFHFVFTIPDVLPVSYTHLTLPTN